MLERDPSKRATAAEVLNHDWVKENGVAGDVEIEPEVRRHAPDCNSHPISPGLAESMNHSLVRKIVFGAMSWRLKRSKALVTATRNKFRV